MTDPSPDWTDEQVLEYARKLVTDRLQQAVRAMERGCTIEEMLADQGLPSVTMQVIEADIREIGHVDFQAPYHLARQWVYRDRRQPEKFFVISLGNRTLLRQRGHAVLVAFVQNERDSN